MGRLLTGDRRSAALALDAVIMLIDPGKQGARKALCICFILNRTYVLFRMGIVSPSFLGYTIGAGGYAQS